MGHQRGSTRLGLDESSRGSCGLRWLGGWQQQHLLLGDDDWLERGREHHSGGGRPVLCHQVIRLHLNHHLRSLSLQHLLLLLFEQPDDLVPLLLLSPGQPLQGLYVLLQTEYLQLVIMRVWSLFLEPHQAVASHHVAAALLPLDSCGPREVGGQDAQGRLLGQTLRHPDTGAGRLRVSLRSRVNGELVTAVSTVVPVNTERGLTDDQSAAVTIHVSIPGLEIELWLLHLNSSLIIFHFTWKYCKLFQFNSHSNMSVVCRL